MKKSVVFLINGLGIETSGSYSIAIDQCMPKLSRVKETSFFTTAVIDSLEYRSAYEQFFLGDTYKKELKFIKDQILGETLSTNPTYQDIVEGLSVPTAKLHVFLEPVTERIVEEVNDFVKTLPLDSKREVYLHLLVTQQTVQEYPKLIQIVNYIKYHLDTRITVGFMLGKEFITDVPTKEEIDTIKKLFFFCSAERWSDTEKKLITLRDANVRPCMIPGFCATNSCTIQNGDVILFFNTKRTSYDKFIQIIEENKEWAFKTNESKLPIYSMIQLDTKYTVPCFAPSILYDHSLANLLQKASQKALIITDEKNISLVNFLANGLIYQNNPSIQFIKNDDAYCQNPSNIQNIIENTDFGLIIFDYHMDTSKTINDLKEQLQRIDVVLGNVASVCENKHSLLITSLYGLKREMPLAPYNPEMVTLNYERQIPIFFFDYSYPRTKYTLSAGETNDILFTALRLIWETEEIPSLLRLKGFINFFKSVKNG